MLRRPCLNEHPQAYRRLRFIRRPPPTDWHIMEQAGGGFLYRADKLWMAVALYESAEKDGRWRYVLLVRWGQAPTPAELEMVSTLFLGRAKHVRFDILEQKSHDTFIVQFRHCLDGDDKPDCVMKERAIASFLEEHRYTTLEEPDLELPMKAPRDFVRMDQLEELDPEPEQYLYASTLAARLLVGVRRLDRPRGESYVRLRLTRRDRFPSRDDYDLIRARFFGQRRTLYFDLPVMNVARPYYLLELRCPLANPMDGTLRRGIARGPHISPVSLLGAEGIAGLRVDDWSRVARAAMALARHCLADSNHPERMKFIEALDLAGRSESEGRRADAIMQALGPSHTETAWPPPSLRQAEYECARNAVHAAHGSSTEAWRVAEAGLECLLLRSGETPASVEIANRQKHDLLLRLTEIACAAAGLQLGHGLPDGPFGPQVVAKG